MLAVSACLATWLAACVHSDGPPVVDPRVPSDIRVTLPAAPDGIGACLKRSFPEIPDRALTRADVVRVLGEAKVLDRAKTRCGERALAWITAVRRDLAVSPAR